MKTILTTLNANYIHTSLALRWLYVVNKARFDLSFKEYVTKEDVHKIADDLLAHRPDVIGVGVYIWNVEKVAQLILRLKAIKPDLILLVGGPEVSYDPAHFLDRWPINYVISGEGEFVLGELLSAIQKPTLHKNEPTDTTRYDAGTTAEAMDTVPEKLNEQIIAGVSSRQHISPIVAKADLAKLATYPSPYQLEEDLPDLKNRLVYVETSRGCPYQCGYCLSSLEKGVRYFPQAYVTNNLTYLIRNQARKVKFLDRTFNLNKGHTRTLFDFLIEHYRPGISFQFEIYADLLDNPLLEYLNKQVPPHYFRFEIGIQSTYEPTNQAVNRKQDFHLLAANIRRLTEGGKIDLHLDLIAGLPYETFDRFRQSFNDVFALGAKEIQLGFLKMLRGTSLRNHASHFGYVFDEKAPYEIISHQDISAEELARIHAAEHALERYWNSGKFKHTMQRLFEGHYKNRHFELFDEIGQYYVKQQLPEHGYHLEDTFLNLHHFLQSKEIDLFSELRTDYYGCFKIRPHGFWKEKMDKKQRKQLLYTIGNDKNFLHQHLLSRKIIEKQTAIDKVEENDYLLTVFCNDGSRENPLFIRYKIQSV